MMRENSRQNGKMALWWFMVMLIVTVGGVAGCATTNADLAGERAARTLWQSREQFVKIEKQDKPVAGMAPANAHPVNVPVERLRDMLESIEVRSDKDKNVPLFYDEELSILSDKLHAGLATAGPDEDVTFAIIGHYPVLLGLKERMVTTGRVFCRDGQLDIIFGDVHRSVKDNEDRRLYPFLAGSRAVVHHAELRLTARSGGESFAMKRPDWVTFPLVSSAVPVLAPAVRGETGSTSPAGTVAPSAVPPAKPAATGKKSIEERLKTLNDLHDKKLITDEEYRTKRQEILNEL